MGHLLSDPSPGSTKKMKSVAILLFIGLSMAAARTTTRHQMTYKQALKAKSIQCDLCTALDGVFPGAGSSCNTIVETYLPQIIEGLVNNQLSPSAVCSALTLCPAKKLF